MQVAIAGELNGRSQNVLPAGKIALGRLELARGCLLRYTDAVLLGLKEVKRDRVRVEGLQDLAALIRELSERLRQDDPTLRGLGLTRAVESTPGYQEFASTRSADDEVVMTFLRPGFLSRGQVMSSQAGGRTLLRAGTNYGLEVQVSAGAADEANDVLTLVLNTLT